MKKVLVVMASLYNGGAERSLVNMLTEFPPDKYKIDLLLFKRAGMFLNQVPSYVNILDTPKDLSRLYGGLKDAKALLPIKLISNAVSRAFTKNSREMRGFRWKYFYGKHISVLPGEYDAALAYISGEVLYYVSEKVRAKKKIVWIHNDYRSAMHPRKYDYTHLKNMDALVSISDSCVDILKEEFPEFEDKTYMLENITSSTTINKRANEFFPEEFTLDQFNILSIGRLHEQKGFDIAIEAATVLKNKGCKFVWYIIGTGELQETLSKMIVENNLKDSFVLLGARENPYPYIKNCDIFVQPSRYEGKSVVLDEAKIIGVPIIATAYPTVGDQLVDNIEGMIANLNVNDLSNTIEKMMNDDELRLRLINNLNRNEYGNQKEINKYINLIDNCAL